MIKLRELIIREVGDPFRSLHISRYDDIILYRAGNKNEKGIKAWVAFSPEIETAEAYLDNPGFGGDTLRMVKISPLKQTIYFYSTASDFIKLARLVGLDGERGERWYDRGSRYPWEENFDNLRELLNEKGIEAIIYRDDFPEGATSIVLTDTGLSNVNVKEERIIKQFNPTWRMNNK